MTVRSSAIRNMVIAAFMLAVAYVLPNFTGNIPEIGAMLLPMHLPTILCGFLCGGFWGAAVGFVAPLLRSLLTGGFPPMFPTATAMAFEMAVYGLTTGVLSRRFSRSLKGIYGSLILSMFCGRIVWGVVMTVISMSCSTPFSLALFLAGAFTNAIPGIILQLVAIPALLLTLQKSGRMPAEANT